MADGIHEKIDINAADVGELTQLPGIAVNVARNIINHRTRHGLFTFLEELREVKDFPSERLAEIRERIHLGEGRQFGPPRHPDAHDSGQTRGYTKALRTTRGKDRAHETAGHRPPKKKVA